VEWFKKNGGDEGRRWRSGGCNDEDKTNRSVTRQIVCSEEEGDGERLAS
jgi:hypothetical protein